MRVRVLVAPINPADLNAIEGTIRSVRAPGVPGVEGVAVVEQSGDAVKSAVRSRVLLPAWFGTWCGVCREAAGLVVVPPEIAVEQAAMLRSIRNRAAHVADFVALRAETG